MEYIFELQLDNKEKSEGAETPIMESPNEIKEINEIIDKENAHLPNTRGR